MKKNQLFQFSLTVICSMVLAACGSSGGSSNPTTQATNTTPAPTATPTPAPTTPAPTSEVANAASSENTDKQKLTTEAAATPFIGYKHVSKSNSGFIINETEGGSNGADTPVGMNVKNPNRSFDTLVVAEPVQQEEGKPAKVGYLEDFDFRKDQTKYATTAASNTAADKAAGGVLTLRNDIVQTNGIYLDTDKTAFEVTGTTLPATQKSRGFATADTDTSKVGVGNTKTNTRGVEAAATVLVYDGADVGKFTDQTAGDTPATIKTANEADHNLANKSALLKNYTDTHFTADTMASVARKADGSVKYNTDGTVDIDANTAPTAGILSRLQLNRNGGYKTYAAQEEQDKSRVAAADKVSGEKNVGEVYGYRTFAYAGEYNTGSVHDVKAPNLPLENAQLTKVQYGRVTTQLSNHNSFSDFKKGSLQNSAIESYVVDYGSFGSEGTEDHYFYRGVDGITAAQLKALKDKGTTLTYWGHAVSYGLNNKYDGTEAATGAPTAIGAGGNARFVSGNHVRAVVNTGTGDVNGSIFNTWVVPTANNANKGNLKGVDLVQFEGKLAANGNIAGTSKLAYDESSTGVFGANLYGAQAQEMGGVVASHDKTAAGKWGAVFGAIAGSSSEIQNATNRGL